MSLKELQKSIDYEFKDINLLKLAITHKSFNNKSNNERLEYFCSLVNNNMWFAQAYSIAEQKIF